MPIPTVAMIRLSSGDRRCRMTRRVHNSTRTPSRGERSRYHEYRDVRQRCRGQERVADEGARHHQLALREVDQLGRPQHHGEPERDKRIDESQGEPADDLLQSGFGSHPAILRSRQRPHVRRAGFHACARCAADAAHRFSSFQRGGFDDSICAITGGHEPSPL